MQTEHEPIAAILESNNELEKLIINKNGLPPSTENKLSVNINKLINLKVLNIDLINISKDMILKLTTFSSTATTRKLYIYNHDNQSTEVLDVAGSMHNTNTLTLCKQSSEMNNISSFGAVLKTGVLLLVWWQDNAMCKSEVIRLLRASVNIITIKLLNVSGMKLTEQEEDTIATVVRENTQLENIWLGSRACKSVVDDFHTFHSEHNNHTDNESNSKNSKNSKPMFISHEFLFKIVSELQCHANLKTLDLSTCSDGIITEELAEQLAIVIANSTKLETLLLENCSLGNKGVNVIAISLKNVNTLKHLDLSNNNITESDYIVTILEANTGLEKLHLEKNQLQFTAGDRLCLAIASLMKLKVLSIDQGIISLMTVFSSGVDMHLLIHNHNHQRFEKIDMRASFNNIHALTLCKLPTVMEDIIPLMSFILDNGSAMLWWTQSNVLNTSAVLSFISSLKKITIVKLLNNSDSELTELEVDTIATVISENVQLESLWLGSQSLRIICDDFDTLAKENIINIQVFSSDEMIDRKDQSANQQKCVKLSPTKKMFHDKLLLKFLWAFQTIANVKTLDLSGNVFTEESAQKLAIVITNSTKIESLLLKDCSLRNEVVNVITTSLRNMNTLKQLDLSSNNITKVDIIVPILESNTRLEMLHLKVNHCADSERISFSIANMKNLKVLSIDQTILNSALLSAFSTGVERKLFIYDHNYQRTEVINIRGSFNNITALTLCKIPDVREGQHIITLFILDNGSAMIWWTQSNVLNSSGVLRFISSLKKITTVKLLNNSDSELTEPEVDTIATVIIKNVQLESLWLGNQSPRIINDDFLALDKENISKEISKDEMISRNDRSVGQQKYLTFLPAKKLFQDKVLLKILYALQKTVNIKALDLSGNMITEELAEQLAVVLDNSTELETLLLRDCSLSRATICVIANSLKNITTLKVLSLSWNNITEVTANNIATIIQCNTGLVEVCLDGSLQPFNQISTAIKKLNLKLLHLDYKLITEESNYELRNLVINKSKLECLVLKNYLLQVAGIMMFEPTSRSIKSLIIAKLKANALVTQDPSTSALSLVDENKIIVYWSQDNILASTGILRVINAFKDVTSIIMINDTFNDYTDEDADEIIASLASFTKLEELLFALKGYSTTFFKSVFDSLNTLTTIRSFDLAGNKIPKNATAKLTALLMNNNNIQKLHLNHCMLTTSPVKELTNSLKTHSNINALCFHNNIINDILDVANDIGEILLKNQHMEKFYVGENKLHERGIIKILAAFKQLHKLKELSISSNNITDNMSNDTLQIRCCISDFLVEVITNNPKLEILGINYVCTHADDALKVVKALTSFIIFEVTGHIR